MTSSVFPLRLDETDRYLLRRLALERGQSANALVTMLVRAEIDRALPGARDAYQRRGEVAEQVLRRRRRAPSGRGDAPPGIRPSRGPHRADGLHRDRTA
jgi:hypothetical protein